MSTNYEQFGKYLLLEKIAAGGMAEVYLSKSTAANGLNKYFAIKRILPQYSTNEEFVSMFKEEANVAINLNHSNVVSIFDFGIEKQQFYLVMDYVEGKNLRQIINELKKSNKSFSIDQALYMVKEAASGLDHAHRCTDSKSGRPLNITHRDMSPQNIMISFEGEVKVIDFGIAKAESEKEDTKAGTLKGKFGYMSPEQAEGQPIDPRTDVFALGIVLWELLANDRLFTGSNEAAILRKVRECQVPSIRKVNPTISPELERIVMKALAKDKNVRYQTAANLHRDLNRFLNTQFPDFSAQDFSQFIKDSFKTAVTECRDKLINYSKAVSAPVVEEMKTKPVPPPPQSPPNEAAPAASSAPAEPPPKINLEGLRDAAPAVKVNLTQTAASVKVSKPFNPNTRITHTSQSSSKSNNVSFSDVAMKALLVVILLGGGYWGYNNFINPTPNTPAKAVATTKQQKDSKGQIDLSATAAVKVSVSSTPQGADIFLDGVDTKYKTPAIITVTANKDNQIVLRKEGFLEYSVARKFAETSQLSATLQASAQAAYLNIYLSNGGSTTKISINGKELSERIPIMKYAVVAQQEVVVSAYNPITKLSDEVRVRMKPGEKKDIELILGRNPEQSNK